jgi:hypothetical protein
MDGYVDDVVWRYCQGLRHEKVLGWGTGELRNPSRSVIEQGRSHEGLVHLTRENARLKDSWIELNEWTQEDSSEYLNGHV